MKITLKKPRDLLVPTCISALMCLMFLGIYLGTLVANERSIMTANVERSQTYLLALELELMSLTGLLSQTDPTACSADTITSLRTLEYQLQYFSDIAVLDDDKNIVCSSTLGAVANLQIDMEKMLSTPMDSSLGSTTLFTTAENHIDPDSQGFYISFNNFLLTINKRLLLTDSISGTQISLVTDTPRGLAMIFEEDAYFQRSDLGQLSNGRLSLLSCQSATGICIVGSHEIINFDRSFLIATLISAGLAVLLGFTSTLAYRAIMNARTSLRVKLLKAISNRELSVVYQPIVRLQDQTLVGAEALVRWIDSDGQFIPPDVFCTIAEQAGFSNKITDYVIDYTIKHIWSRPGLRDLPIAFNIAPNEILQDQFVSHYTSLFARSGIALNNAKFEITERMQVDLEKFSSAIAHVARSGFRISLDDFGTGHSSFPYLNQLPIETIKLDRSFVNAVGEDSAYGKMLPHMIDMLQAVDREIVVEGVETEEQRQWFAQKGDLLAQGYFFSRPLMPEAMMAFAAQDASQQDERVVRLKFGAERLLKSD